MGTFHFANPNKDAVKFKTKDVMSKDSQDYLKKLAQRISEYRPTIVLLEYDEKNDKIINDRYAQYREGKFQLTANEIEQLGFRVAELAQLDRVHTFDERIIQWQGEKLLKQLKHEPEMERRFKESIHKMSEEENEAHASLSLRELLKRYNSPEIDRLNKSIYLMTNATGAVENFAGADAAASWWHRNFRMFARIQRLAQPGERLLVIGGQGHIAILRDFSLQRSILTYKDSN